MLVFLSWSGARSRFVAEILETWLAQVIQAIEPWKSQDIEKGLRWGPEIADRLERSKVGIICLTRDNLDSRWIHFEAGALSKTKDAYVCTLLLDMKPSDIEQPLAQFQHTTTSKDDIFQLLLTVNRVVQKAGERALSETALREIFEVYWPRLAKALHDSVDVQESTTSPSRSEREMLEEVLELLRHQERRQTHIDARERFDDFEHILLLHDKPVDLLRWAFLEPRLTELKARQESKEDDEPDVFLPIAAS